MSPDTGTRSDPDQRITTSLVSLEERLDDGAAVHCPLLVSTRKPSASRLAPSRSAIMSPRADGSSAWSCRPWPSWAYCSGCDEVVGTARTRIVSLVRRALDGDLRWAAHPRHLGPGNGTESGRPSHRDRAWPSGAGLSRWRNQIRAPDRR